MAYPFRKPFWTNWIFTFTVVCIFLLNCCFLVLPSDTLLTKFFECEPYTDNVKYKYRVTIGIVLCVIITFIAEKLIAVYLTSYFDRRGAANKASEFLINMQNLLEKHRNKTILGKEMS